MKANSSNPNPFTTSPLTHISQPERQLDSLSSPKHFNFHKISEQTNQIFRSKFPNNLLNACTQELSTERISEGVTLTRTNSGITHEKPFFACCDDSEDESEDVYFRRKRLRIRQQEQDEDPSEQKSINQVSEHQESHQKKNIEEPEEDLQAKAKSIKARLKMKRQQQQQLESKQQSEDAPNRLKIQDPCGFLSRSNFNLMDSHPNESSSASNSMELIIANQNYDDLNEFPPSPLYSNFENYTNDDHPKQELNQQDQDGIEISIQDQCSSSSDNVVQEHQASLGKDSYCCQYKEISSSSQSCKKGPTNPLNADCMSAQSSPKQQIDHHHHHQHNHLSITNNNSSPFSLNSEAHYESSKQKGLLDSKSIRLKHLPSSVSNEHSLYNILKKFGTIVELTLDSPNSANVTFEQKNQARKAAQKASRSKRSLFGEDHVEVKYEGRSLDKSCKTEESHGCQEDEPFFEKGVLIDILRSKLEIEDDEELKKKIKGLIARIKVGMSMEKNVRQITELGIQV